MNVVNKKLFMYNKRERIMETKEFDLESKLQTYVMKRLRSCPEIKLLKTIRSNIVGAPDLIMCVRGRYVAIELKVKQNKCTPHQKRFLDEVHRAGGIAAEARTWGEVKDVIRLAGYNLDEFYEEEIKEQP